MMAGKTTGELARDAAEAVAAYEATGDDMAFARAMAILGHNPSARNKDLLERLNAARRRELDRAMHQAERRRIPQAVVTLPLEGLPDCCGSCGRSPRDGRWLLGVYGNVLNVTCPACLTVVAPVRAVAAHDPECE